jgi:hypothetical protein
MEILGDEEHAALLKAKVGRLRREIASRDEIIRRTDAGAQPEIQSAQDTRFRHLDLAPL